MVYICEVKDPIFVKQTGVAKIVKIPVTNQNLIPPVYSGKAIYLLGFSTEYRLLIRVRVLPLTGKDFAQQR